MSDRPGSHSNFGKGRFSEIQAACTTSQIAFDHSTMLGGSSDSIYLIPKPPPTFNSVTFKPCLAASLNHCTITAAKSLCG